MVLWKQPVPLAVWEGSGVDLKRGEVVSILGTLLRSGLFSCIDGM